MYCEKRLAAITVESSSCESLWNMLFVPGSPQFKSDPGDCRRNVIDCDTFTWIEFRCKLSNSVSNKMSWIPFFAKICWLVSRRFRDLKRNYRTLVDVYIRIYYILMYRSWQSCYLNVVIFYITSAFNRGRMETDSLIPVGLQRRFRR